MSLELSSCIPPLVGTPSIIRRGSLLLSVPIPLMRILAEPLGLPSADTVIPATLPCKDLIGLFSADFLISSTFTTETAPVKSAFFCVVYPVTTICSSTLVSDSSNTLIDVRFLVFTSSVFIPTIENTSVSLSAGNVILNSPSRFVTVPMVPPFTITVTPINGSLSSAEMTVPVTVLF